MGLRVWVRAVRSEPDIVWVPGKFQVTASSQPAFNARGSSGWWTGVLAGPGIQPTPLTHHGIAPNAHWPQPGQTIDVTFVPTDLTLIKFDWAAAPTPEEVGLEQARRLAEQLKPAPPIPDASSSRDG